MRQFGWGFFFLSHLWQELYSVVHFIQPGCFGTSASFEANFITPIKNGLRRDASALELAHSKAASETLYQRLCIGSPPGGAVYLRRDKSLIAHTLPKKEDSILFCSMTPMQIDLYSKMLLLPEFQLLFDSVQKCPHHGTPRRQVFFFFVLFIVSV
jgi:SNF2 family DNA or RNA helicase